MNEFLEAVNIFACEDVVEDTFEVACPCLVCGESVAVDKFQQQVLICDKCKKAILYMRD